MSDIQIAYICDRMACNGGCPSLVARGKGAEDYCQHTTDIRHALNFQKISADGNDEERYIEKEVRMSYPAAYCV